ncbi:MAG: cupin [Alphaproteobacteria bacterium]|nr:MAG: cupin [Alphaproteobacteria bacterium]
MNINSDFSVPVALHADRVEWQPSPMPGVDRRMLDRIGAEVARATSIVRYAPQSSFSEHTHNGGEEFIVLEGTFQDEHGDYPAGTYVRNPIGTHHIPRSDDGCTIFVKLWQFDARDNRQFAVDLSAVLPMQDGDHPNFARQLLHQFEDEHVWLEFWPAGSTGVIEAESGAELLVLEGGLEFDGETFERNDWIRLPVGHSAEMISGPDGARIWVKTGHLTNVSAPQV